MPALTTEREKMLEAMLFASGESVPVSKLAEALGCDIPLVRNLLAKMADTYSAQKSGIQLREVDDCFRLCTNPEYFDVIKKLLNIKPRRALTQTLLETLAIIAFKQPVTKAVIENIRGVNSDHGVNRLVEYGLVEEKGRLDAPGRPILFGTSEEFLLFYGLRNVEEFLDATDTTGV
ncbi:MAG: SMC-Scp complex subunit ScpB [Defluviitaleaceae bacterium]|nr:SMC-Scp complex subunit ScpB [Defluviitaleaceae bacterium]MCL2262543.1 SMC-Scp complex subunit ScpB [Defluviitaleaceae bacterium]